MVVLLKTASVRVSFIQIMQVRVQNKGKRVWKARYIGDISPTSLSSASRWQRGGWTVEDYWHPVDPTNTSFPSDGRWRSFFVICQHTVKKSQMAKTFFVVCQFFAVCSLTADGKDLLGKELADGKIHDSSSVGLCEQASWMHTHLLSF